MRERTPAVFFTGPYSVEAQHHPFELHERLQHNPSAYQRKSGPDTCPGKYTAFAARESKILSSGVELLIYRSVPGVPVGANPVAVTRVARCRKTGYRNVVTVLIVNDTKINSYVSNPVPNNSACTRCNWDQHGSPSKCILRLSHKFLRRDKCHSYEAARATTITHRAHCRCRLKSNLREKG